jgi:oxygen-dependent protoporphyrinogen oxidase
VVIGAGVSGLAVGFEILERSERLPGGVRLVCLESGDRPGGHVRSSREDGFVCEWGPTAFLDSAPATLTLVRRLGLQERLIGARPGAAHRYLYCRGRLRPLPGHPRQLLRCGILSLPGALRLALGALLPGAVPEEHESVHEFASRRMGREAATTLAGALVGGLCGGDARRLSARATLRELQRLALQRGTLFRALVPRDGRDGAGAAPDAAPGSPGRLVSFRGGMQELTDALATALGDRLRLASPVLNVNDMGWRGYRVLGVEGPPLDVASVVLACPAPSAARLVDAMDPEMARAFSGIPSAPIAVVHLGYREADIGARPPGFGFLAPRGQGLGILGSFWASDVFEGRAPAGCVLLTAMLGGAHDPAAVDRPDEDLIDEAQRDLQAAIGFSAAACYVRVIRHPGGIPQYELGHAARMATIDSRLALHPGLFVTGWSYRGVSINACVEDASRVAEAVVSHVAGVNA